MARRGWLACPNTGPERDASFILRALIAWPVPREAVKLFQAWIERLLSESMVRSRLGDSVRCAGIRHRFLLHFLFRLIRFLLLLVQVCGSRRIRCGHACGNRPRVRRRSRRQAILALLL